MQCGTYGIGIWKVGLRRTALWASWRGCWRRGSEQKKPLESKTESRSVAPMPIKKQGVRMTSRLCLPDIPLGKVRMGG